MSNIEKKIQKAIPLIGTQFNHLTITRIDEERCYSKTNKYKRVYCFASCDCGSGEKSYELQAVKSGHTKSCGCSKFNNPLIMEDLTGKTFGRLTVVKRDIQRDRNRKSKGGNAHWLCRCSCGNPDLVSIGAYKLKTGETKSCGCLASETTAARNKIYSPKKNKTYLYKNNYQENDNGYVRFWDESGDNSFIVDKEDAEYVSQWYWRKSLPRRHGTEGYWISNAKQKDIDAGYPTTLRLHQMIAERKYGKYDKKLFVPDHINREHDDNTRKNIKLKSNMENSKNRNVSYSNTSGKTGVSYNKRDDDYDAYITVNYKTINLGSYKKFEDAVKARKDAEIKYGFTCDDVIPEYDHKINLDGTFK